MRAVPALVPGQAVGIGAPTCLVSELGAMAMGCGTGNAGRLCGPGHTLILLSPQAPAHRCLLHLPLGPAAGAAPGRALSTGCLARLAGHAQVQYHVPLLPGGLHRSCGYKESDRPTEVPAPKVREAAVTAGGGQVGDGPGSAHPRSRQLSRLSRPIPLAEPYPLPRLFTSTAKPLPCLGAP